MKRRPIMELLISTFEAKVLAGSGHALEGVAVDYPGGFFRPEAIGLRWLEVRLVSIDHIQDSPGDEAEMQFTVRCFISNDRLGAVEHALDDLVDGVLEVFDRSEGGGQISTATHAINPVAISETRVEKTEVEAGGQTVKADLAEITITARVGKG